MHVSRTFAAALLLCAAAMQTLSAQDWDPPRRWRHRDGVQIRVGRDYYLPPDQIASWPIVVIGGSATVDGRVDDDLVVIGGPVRLGPGAQVRGDVVALGGEVIVADTAEISGEVHDVSVVWPEIRFAFGEWLWGIDRAWWAAFTLAATAFRFAVVMIGVCLLALVAPHWIRRIGERVVETPIASGLAGFATQLLIVPVTLIAIVGMILTLVGIPLLLLLPFALLGFLLCWLAGFATVAAFVGGWLRSRLGLSDPGLVLDAAWGVALLFLLTFFSNLLVFGPPLAWPMSASLGFLGFAVEYVAWTIGLGAMLLAPLQRRWGATPPPLPSTASVGA